MPSDTGHAIRNNNACQMVTSGKSIVPDTRHTITIGMFRYDNLSLIVAVIVIITVVLIGHLASLLLFREDIVIDAVLLEAVTEAARQRKAVAADFRNCLIRVLFF